MKTRLIRQNYDGINSLFSIKAKYITDTFDTEGNKLKFEYNISKEKLTVFGDYKSIYVLCE